MKRSVYTCFFLLAIIAAAVILFPTEKKRIKKVIDSGRESVIKEDIEGLMETVSFNYSDDHGGSYLQFKKRAELLFKSYDDFDITMDIKRITVDGDRASAGLDVSIIVSEGDERGYLIGDAGAHREISLFFERSTYGWKVEKIEGIAGTSGPGMR